MVAIVSGNSLGLNLSSLAALGSHGRIGTATQGRNGEGAFVNVSSGNLVLQDMDGLLMGVGANVASLRTYNSQGLANFTNDDGWRIGQYKSVVAVGGNVLQRTDGDGSTASYAWDAASQSYLATVGAGSVVNSIKANGDGSYTWTNGATGATERYAGTGSGLIQSSTDTSGNTLAFQYDGSGLLTKVTDADGESVNYTYSGHNLVGLSTTLQSGQTLSEVTYGYDAQDRLTSVGVNLDPSSGLPSGSETLSSYVTNYTYDGTSDRIAGITQSDSTSLSFTYVQAGGSYRVASASDGLGNTTSFSYDTNANTTTVTDPLGTSSVYSYDSKGQLTQVRDGVTAANSAGLSQLSYAYNSLGDVSALTDGSGNTVQLEYDARGNLISQVDGGGDTHTWTYNAANQVQTSTVYTTPAVGQGANAAAASGLETTRYVYASSNPTQLRFVVTPEGDVTEYHYNANGLRTSTLSYAGGTYDSSSLSPTGVPTEAQMQTWTTTQDLTRSQRVDMVYDFRGQLQSSTSYAGVDASGAGVAASAKTTQYVYDQRGELLQSIQPNAASVTHYTYDGLGRVVSASAPSLDGPTPNLSLTSYDDANGKTTLTLANGLSTVSTFDHAGRLVSVVQSCTSGSLGATSYSYDKDGHLLMTQDPTGAHHWMMYDAEGRKVADIDGTGMLTENVYNGNGQLGETIAYATSVDITQLSDASGTPLTAWGSTVTLSSIRPTATSQDEKAWSFYDGANRLAWQVDGLGHVTQTTYDGESRVLSVTRLATAIDVSQLDPGAIITLPSTPMTGEVTLSIDATSASLGTQVVLTANVDGANSSGMVTFFSGETVVGSAMVANGTATLISTKLSVGVNDIRAVYSGNTQRLPSLSGVVQKTATKAITSAALNFSPATASAGQAVTLSATLNTLQALDVAAATGEINFYNGDTLLGTAVLVDGVASLTLSTLPAGTLSIRSEYAGDAMHTAVMATQGLTVQPADPILHPSITVSASIDSPNAPPVAAPSAIVSNGEAIDLTATVMGASKNGRVMFFAGSLKLGAATVVNGVATLKVDSLRAGTYTLNTVYLQDGDGFSDVNVSGPNLQIDASQSNSNSIDWQWYDANGGFDFNTGEFQLFLNGTPVDGNVGAKVGTALGITEWDGGGNYGSTGTYRIFIDNVLVGYFEHPGHSYKETGFDFRLPTPLTAGTDHVVEVVFFPESDDPVGNDASGFGVKNSMQFIVSPADTLLALSASPGNAPAGTPLTLNAKVTIGPPSAWDPSLPGPIATAAPAVGGTVSFYANEQLIGTAPVVNGQASLATNSLSEGSADITASYSGDANYLVSSSPSALQVTVAAPPPSPLTNLTASLIAPNGALSVRVNGTSPTGLVSFYDGLNLLGTAQVVNGVATLSGAPLPPGTHTFTAAYAGDANNVEAAVSFTQLVTGTPLTQVMVELDPTRDRTVTELYDRDSRLQATIDGEGFLTQYRYDSAGRLVETIGYANPVPGFTDAQSIASAVATARTSYDLSALLPASTTTDIHSYRFYNARGQAVGQVDGDGYLTETVYDANGNVAQSIRYATPATGVTSTSTLAQIRPASTPQDQVVTQTWNAANELASRTGVDGTVTTFAYDSVGHLLQTTTALGTADQRTLTARYDVQGRVVAELSADGSALLTGNQTPAQIDAIWAQYATTYTYDAAGRRTSTTDAVGNRTVFFYDDAGRLRYTANALGAVTENTYDALGHLGSITRYATPLSGTALTALQGGLLSSSANLAAAAALDAAKAASTQNSTTQYAYDAHGQEVLVTDALGGTTALSYDAFGDLAQSTRTFTGTQSVTSTSSHDRRGLQTGAVADVGTSNVNATTQAQYDAFGRLIQSVDANGNITSASYDALGRTLSATDGAGGTRTTTYDAFGRTLTQTDALGATTTYSYDTAARSVTLTTAEGVVLTTVNTRTGQTQSVTDGDGNTTSYHYDADGNLLSTATPLTTTSNQYDAADRLTRSTDANGHVVSYAYDAANRLLSRTVDPNGLNLVTSYQYDAKGEQISATDPSGTVTAFSYDLKGEVLTQTVDPAGLALTTVYTYDQAGHTLSVTSPAGTLTQFSYDDLGRRTLAVVDPAGLALATSYQYDATGNMVASTDPNGNLSRYVYDADNRVSYAVDGAGNVTHYAYDANGRVTSTIHYATPISLDGLPPNASATDIAGRVVAIAALDAAQNNVYDADGRLTYTVDGTGAVASYTYDGAGNVVSRTHYANRIDLSSWTPGTTPAVAPSEYGAQGQDEVLRTVYDSLNRAIYTIDATGAVTAQTYDADGNVVDRIAYASPVYIGEPFTKATLDAAVAGLAQPDDAHTRAVYDAANRLVWSVDGTGAVTHNDYDADGRLTSQTRFATAIAAGAAPDSVQASNADRRTDMLYDAAGRMVYQMRWTDRSNLASGVGDMRFVTSYAYDGDGRMTRETEHQLPLFSSVPNDLTDVYGNLTVAPEDRSTYMAYDAAGRMTYGVDAAGGITRNTYDGAGNVIASTRLANAAQTLPAGDHTVNGYTIPGLSAAQIAALVQPDALNDRTTLAAFDSAGRKVYAVDALGYVTQTRYDGVGRITASTQFANAATGLGIGATADAIANAVSPNAAADRTDSFAYDAAGNLIASTDALGHTESYVYNGLGEKTAFTNKLGATWNYAYDAAGRMTIEYAPDPSASEYQAYYGGLYADAQTVMTYDALGNMTSRTEGAETPNQRTTRYVYDAMGRQIGTIYPEVAVYNPAGDEVNDAYYGGAYGERSETWVTPTVQVVYDVFGDAVANVDVAGNISTKAYDKLGQVLYEVDALGYVTGYQRNDFGDVIALTRYASANAAVTPDGANAPTASQVENALAPSAADRTITTDYDLLGRAVRVTQPAAWVSNGSGQSYQASEVTTTAYDAFGDVVQTAALADLPANSWATTHYYYDRRGQQVASVDALGFLTTQSFDAAGNNTSVTQYANATSSTSLTGYTAGAASTTDRSVVYSYDQANRKTSQTQFNVSYSTAPDGSFVTGNLTTTYGYDALGNNTRTTDALGNNTYTYYDALGRIKAVASPSFTGSGGATIIPLTEFDRDVYGNVVRKIQYANAAWANETQYAAGSDGTGPDDRVTTTQYDSHGNATEVDDATGVAHYMSYDVQGHLAKAWQDVSGNDGIEQVLYSLFQYDALGRQTAVITPASTSVVSGGQIVTEAQSEAGSITTGMAWDAFGDMVQRDRKSVV